MGAHQDPVSNGQKQFITLSLYEGRKEKSMIKVEKMGNTTHVTADGNAHVLIDEFQTVLHVMYRVLEKNIKDPESVTPRDLMHSMVENVVKKESEMNKA